MSIFNTLVIRVLSAKILQKSLLADYQQVTSAWADENKVLLIY